MLWELSKANLGIMLTSIIITLIFIIIETAPVVVKLISHQSVYDLYINFEIKDAHAEIRKKEACNNKKLQQVKIKDLDDQLKIYDRKKQISVNKVFIDSIIPIEKEKIKQFLHDWKTNIFSKQEYFDDFQNIFHRHIKDLLNRNLMEFSFNSEYNNKNNTVHNDKDKNNQNETKTQVINNMISFYKVRHIQLLVCIISIIIVSVIIKYTNSVSVAISASGTFLTGVSA